MRKSRFPTIARLAATLGACALLAVVSCSRPKNDTIPADPKARSEFLTAAAAKLSSDDRKLLARFVGRLEARESGGNHDAAGGITVVRALELQRSYETQVEQAQNSFQEKLDATQANVRVEIKDAKVVKPERAGQATERALRFVVSVNNRGKKTVERVGLRIEIREASGKYQAAIPDLQLGGPLRPGETGRSVQTLALDPARHQYILDGKPLQINVYPIQVAYADGEKIEPGAELQTLESLHNAKIE